MKVRIIKDHIVLSDLQLKLQDRNGKDVIEFGLIIDENGNKVGTALEVEKNSSLQDILDIVEQGLQTAARNKRGYLRTNELKEVELENLDTKGREILIKFAGKRIKIVAPDDKDMPLSFEEVYDIEEIN